MLLNFFVFLAQDCDGGREFSGGFEDVAAGRVPEQTIGCIQLLDRSAIVGGEERLRVVHDVAQRSDLLFHPHLLWDAVEQECAGTRKGGDDGFG